MTRCLAAHTDDRLRELADKGHKDAQAEMIRRGLAGDPAMNIYIIDRGRAQTGIDRFALVILRDGDELPLEPGWSIHWQGSDIAQAREAINRMRQGGL